jgi:hypothetical protein
MRRASGSRAEASGSTRVSAMAQSEKTAPSLAAARRRCANAAVSRSPAACARVRARFSQPLRLEPKGDTQPASASASGVSDASRVARSSRPGARGDRASSAPPSVRTTMAVSRRSMAVVAAPPAGDGVGRSEPAGGLDSASARDSAVGSSSIPLARASGGIPSTCTIAVAAGLAAAGGLASGFAGAAVGWPGLAGMRIFSRGLSGAAGCAAGRGAMVSLPRSDEAATATGFRATSVKRTRKRPSSATAAEHTLMANRCSPAGAAMRALMRSSPSRACVSSETATSAPSQTTRSAPVPATCATTGCAPAGKVSRDAR